MITREGGFGGKRDIAVVSATLILDLLLESDDFFYSLGIVDSRTLHDISYRLVLISSSLLC